MKTVSALRFLVVAVACTWVVLGQQCPGFSYSGSNGPQAWGSLCPAFNTCDIGISQSPINLQLHTSNVDDFTVELDYEPTNNLPFVNLEHTVEVRYDSNDDSILFLGPFGPAPYTLEQFHVHTPSEHTQDGRHYDMEIHFVHTGATGDTLVLGLWVQATESTSCDFLAQLVNEIPTQFGQQTVVDVSSVFRFDDGTPIFRYSGSLTTPPCTEGVTWLIPAEAVECTSSQVEAFRNVIGESNRPVQSRNGRTVLLNNPNNYSTLSSFTTAYNFFSYSSSTSGAANLAPSAAFLAFAAVAA
eukprot:CAMPEP_0114629318 /NCGR_PEP_ID=MMETSP0168-20121206/13294_1 /TAXON_ID=95228 ORGANISM="Vannella sp., Strain DIVA3 517/6/12" /NCGR_SAMPLE_ID=MMETSP0168 /ASSEMBLY_ACC=CAM_ASM_000044 /LENGTH=298 /DNA_ID=CAMNT_0001840767 /DNA_START=36 /DNA_END=929 /DNA_ORIENTATION=-